MKERAPRRGGKAPGPRAGGLRPYPRIWGPPGRLLSASGRKFPPNYVGEHVADFRAALDRARAGDPARLVAVVVGILRLLGKGRAVELTDWTDDDFAALEGFLFDRLVLPPLDKRAQPAHVAAWVQRLDALLKTLDPKASLAARQSFIRETVATFDGDLAERLPLRAILAAGAPTYYKSSRKKSRKSPT